MAANPFKIDGKEVRVHHADILFPFLADERLSLLEREVGVVLILQCQHWRGFVSPLARWDTVVKLSRRSEEEARAVLARLTELGWLEAAPSRDGKGEQYKVAPARIEEIVRRHLEYRALKRQEAKERAKAAAAAATTTEEAGAPAAAA